VMIKHKIILNVILYIVAIVMLAASSPVFALVLDVPERFQEYDEWCWAGVSQSIFNYYGTIISQSTIANYGTNGYNTWNWLWGSDSTYPYYRKGINMILNHWGLSCTYGNYTMSQAQIQSRINAYQPFVIRWGWISGGGHFLTGRGYSGSNIYYMNPGQGEGYNIAPYAWVVNDGNHEWTDSLELTSNAPSSSDYRVLAGGNYNGDFYDDIAIFRPSSGLWSVRGITRCYFGGSSDIPVPGDYDGHGTTSMAIYRPSSGLWACKDRWRVYFGSSSDTPVPADYNGNGRCNLGIFRPSSGLWAFYGGARYYFGGSSDTPVPGDYNGNGTATPAIFRESTGLWAIKGDPVRVYFGGSGDIPVPGDYTNKGDWNAGIYRPSSGLWAIAGMTRCYFGGSSDQPVPGDFNQYWGDDIAVFRASSGLWAIKGLTRCYYGSSGDIPVTR
ncbi:MAG: papain-like cysteine protease family protein, partial [Candidatus Auribacterota bacterium]|nr:papain-like cysteine protease family protein [Candidatus Auribacterota bacterium]